MTFYMYLFIYFFVFQLIWVLFHYINFLDI